MCHRSEIATRSLPFAALLLRVRGAPGKCWRGTSVGNPPRPSSDTPRTQGTLLAGTEAPPTEVTGGHGGTPNGICRFSFFPAAPSGAVAHCIAALATVPFSHNVRLAHETLPILLLRSSAVRRCCRLRGSEGNLASTLSACLRRAEQPSPRESGQVFLSEPSPLICLRAARAERARQRVFAWHRIRTTTQSCRDCSPTPRFELCAKGRSR